MMPKSRATAIPYRHFMGMACPEIRQECRRTSLHVLFALTAFANRQTEVSDRPVAFGEAFSKDPARAVLWTTFIRKSGLDTTPQPFEEVVAFVVQFLGPVAEVLAEGVWSRGVGGVRGLTTPTEKAMVNLGAAEGVWGPSLKGLAAREDRQRRRRQAEFHEDRSPDGGLQGLSGN